MAKVLELPPHVRRRIFARGGRRPGRRDSMNRWEAEWAAQLAAAIHDGSVLGWWWQSVSLRIGERCFYWPDFLVQAGDGTLELHEVKGHMEDDAMVKLRAVIERYPFRVFLVSKRAKREGGGFVTKELT